LAPLINGWRILRKAHRAYCGRVFKEGPAFKAELGRETGLRR
jgi:hypothetical protein